MKRRGFLQSILALGAAPAIVRADSLMRVIPRDTNIITSASTLWPGVKAFYSKHYTDDNMTFEEGYFTPQIEGSTIAYSGPAGAKYIRVGNIVTILNPDLTITTHKIE